jgi:hypothetical protein
VDLVGSSSWEDDTKSVLSRDDDTMNSVFDELSPRSTDSKPARAGSGGSLSSSFEIGESSLASFDVEML